MACGIGSRFEEHFLAVPQECLILTMQQNQKYFPLLDQNGKLMNRFLLVSNLQTEDPSHIIQGNERVLRARLSDAEFFYKQDQKATLESRLPKLSSVVYHNKIGSQAERIERLQSIAAHIAKALGADAAAAERAARLAKADLVTEMVGEFPELQGTMANTTPVWTVKPKKSPKPSSNTTNRVLPATTCQRAKWPPPLLWPTNWKPWSAFGVSA